MLDNELIKIFRPIILQGFLDYGVGDIEVRQQYQPTQTGTKKLPVISFFKVSDVRYGFEERESYYDPGDLKQKSRETQFYNTVFQISCLAAQDPTDENSLTASDLINICASIMQNNATINLLASNDVYVLRITDVRNIPFYDDRDQNEFIPSFDITFKHVQERIIDIDYLTSVDGKIYNV